MASAAGLKYKAVSALVILCILVVAAAGPLTANGLSSCGDVTSSLFSCIDYLQSDGGDPPTDGCCEGVRSLNADAGTTPERQFACNCLKSAAERIPGINIAAAAGLPAKCSVGIPYKISPDTDCSKVK